MELRVPYTWICYISSGARYSCINHIIILLLYNIHIIINDVTYTAVSIYDIRYGTYSSVRFQFLGGSLGGLGDGGDDVFDSTFDDNSKDDLES